MAGKADPGFIWRRRRKPVNDIMTKINANERMVGLGAIIVIIASLFGIFTLYFGGFFGLPCAVIALVVIFLKYSPNTKIDWPIPVPLILVILGGLATLSAAFGMLFGLLELLTIFAFGANVIWLFLHFILSAAVLVGAGMMFFGGYKEYQTKPV
jgi:predicted metal-binding membrane protein